MESLPLIASEGLKELPALRRSSEPKDVELPERSASAAFKRATAAPYRSISVATDSKTRSVSDLKTSMNTRKSASDAKVDESSPHVSFAFQAQGPNPSCKLPSDAVLACIGLENRDPSPNPSAALPSDAVLAGIGLENRECDHTTSPLPDVSVTSSHDDASHDPPILSTALPAPRHHKRVVDPDPPGFFYLTREYISGASTLFAGGSSDIAHFLAFDRWAALQNFR
jgi:hypothetical protein